MVSQKRRRFAIKQKQQLGMPENRFAVKAVIENNEKILLLKRNSEDKHIPNQWELPGGHLKRDEEPVAGLLRELSEECGVSAEVLFPFDVTYVVRENEQPLCMIIFYCQAKNTKITLSKEHSEYRWVSMEGAKEKLIITHNGTIEKLEKIRSGAIFK